MAPEVFFSVCFGETNPSKVIRDLYTFTPAILDDYCRHRVQNADYPAIVPEKGHSVRGVYATGLTDANMSKLDYFEGSEYERIEVSVKLAKKTGGEGERIGEDKEDEVEVNNAKVYVFRYPEQLERVEWDFEHFRKEKMKLWTRGDWAYDQGQSTSVNKQSESLTDSLECRPR